MRALLFLLLTSNAAYAAVLIQGPGTSTLEYRAALKADPDASAPTTQLLRARPIRANRDLLLAAFADAQQSFLDNSLETAAQKFAAVVALAPNDDWSKADRQVLLHSFLRLAQLETDVSARDEVLKRALYTGADVAVEKGLFPPPLLKRLGQIRQQAGHLAVSPQFFKEGWTALLINGVLCQNGACPDVPPGAEQVRVTFLSDIWQTVTVTTEAARLNELRPLKNAWITGDCLRTQFTAASAQWKDTRAFWGINCGAPPAKTPAAVNLNPVAQNDAVPRLEIKESSPAFYKSKWFWAGVGLVAISAAVIMANQKKPAEKEPTTTYGYL